MGKYIYKSMHCYLFFFWQEKVAFIDLYNITLQRDKPPTSTKLLVQYQHCTEQVEKLTTLKAKPINQS